MSESRGLFKLSRWWPAAITDRIASWDAAATCTFAHAENVRRASNVECGNDADCENAQISAIAYVRRTLSNDSPVGSRFVGRKADVNFVGLARAQSADKNDLLTER